LKPQLPQLLQITLGFNLLGKVVRQVAVPGVSMSLSADTAKAAQVAVDGLRRQGLIYRDERGSWATEDVAKAALVQAIGLDFCGVGAGGKWERLPASDSGHLTLWSKHNDVLFGSYDEQRDACAQLTGGDGGEAHYQQMRERLYAATHAALQAERGWILLAGDGGRATASVEVRPATTRQDVGDEGRDTAYNASAFLYKN
jgi:hypothetical protein